MNHVNRTLVSLCVALAAGKLIAQTSTTGEVFGVIRDTSGAIVQRATVTLANGAGANRTLVTDNTGGFDFVQVPPGRYVLTAVSAGFAEFRAEQLDVRVTQTIELSPTLKITGAAATVTVTTQGTLANTTNAVNGRVIDETEVPGLPLPTRNFEQLLSLSPGTVAGLPNNTALGRGDSDIDVNGQQATSNNVIIDGTQVNSIGTNSTPNIAVPSPDAIREFIVQTSLYDATQGRNTGGNVALVTKGGTNKFHGNAFEFFRNEALNANDFFLKRGGQPRPLLRRNQFGATLGGPIFKDNTFFFLSYQGQQEKNGASVVNSISSLNIPTGLTSDRSTATLMAYANSIGIAGINPAALGLLQAKLANGQFAIPSASTRGTQTCSAVLAGGSVPVCAAQTSLSSLSTYKENQFNINIDHNFSVNDNFTARFFSANSPTAQGIISFLGANPFQAPGFGGNLNFRNRLVSLDETHIFRPNLLNDAHFGFSRIKGVSSPQEPFSNAQFGIINSLAGQFPGLATIQVAGLFTLGSGPLADEKSVTGTFQGSDILTWIHSRDQLRIGGDVFRQHVDFYFQFFSRGEMLVNSFADFLAGGTLPVGGTLHTITGLLGNGVRDRGYRATDFDLFVQDDHRLTDNLTINAGIRFQSFGGFHDIRGRLVNFDVNTFLSNHATACTRTASCSSPNNGLQMLSGSQDINPTQFNVAPRIGFAYKVPMSHPLVLRGGYGMYFDRFSARIANLQIFNYPYDIVGVGLGSLQTPFPVLSNLTFPLAPVVPATIPFYFYGAPLAGTQTPISGLYVDTHFSSPYAQQYTFGVQQELTRNLLLEIGYVGAKGTRLINVATLNQTNANPLLTASGFSGNKALNGLDLAQSNAAANFNSLQASLTKRMDKHLQFLAAYTYSRSLDNNSGALENELAALPGDQNNLSTQYGPSDFDRTNRFVLSGMYQLGEVYTGGSKILGQTINGWGAATIATFQSGSPFSVNCIVGSSLYNRADIVPGVPLTTTSGSAEGRLGNYYNTAAFKSTCTNAAPFGTSSRNLLRGPGQKNVDLNFNKKFLMSDTRNVEFRSEFFNFFNFANFANPNSNQAALGAGTITATNAGPRVIQFALKFTY